MCNLPCAGFGIGEDVSRWIDDGDASTGGLCFLSGDVGKGVAAAVGFNPVSQKLGFLDQVALDLVAQRSLPGAAERHIEGYGGGQDNDEERRHQLQENPASHFGASKR